jgi:hypothetical protein
MIRPAAPEEAAAGQDSLAEGVSRGLPDAGWVLRLVTAARRSPGLGSHLAIAMLLAAILGIGIRTGIVPMRSYVEDVIFFADNAWRVIWGQRPHVDYSSGLGPVTYLLSALGIKLAGGNLNRLGYGNVFAGVTIGIWAYALLVRRVSGLLAVAGAVMLCLLSLAPVQLGESFRLSTVAMSYNRQGYALLGLLIIESFPLRREAPARGLGGALSTGALCAILLFLKANYFLVGLVLAAISVVWSGRWSGGVWPGWLPASPSSRWRFWPICASMWARCWRICAWRRTPAAGLFPRRLSCRCSRRTFRVSSFWPGWPP